MNTYEQAKQTPQSQQETLPFEMVAISPEDQPRRGWEIQVNGEVVDGPVADAVFAQKKMGIEVQYGKRPEGYDGVIVRELGGGGAVTIPYMVDKQGEIFVGVVEENRPLLGGKVLNVPRGFLDKGETHKDAASRELAEETGYRALGARVIKLVQGLNPNSTYFDTSRSEEEGVSIFAVRVEPEELELIQDENGADVYVFPAHVREQAEGDKPAERILGSRFIPVAEAATSRDMFTSAATGQLMTALFTGKVPYMTAK